MSDEIIPGAVPAELAELAHAAHDLEARLRSLVVRLAPAADLHAIVSTAHFNAQKVAREIDEFIGRAATTRRTP